MVRVRGEASRHRDVIRRYLQRQMPGDSYVTVTPLTEVIGRQTRSWQIGATMFLAFGLLALVLAGIGLYGLIAYTVTRRTHEIGVRIALGARTSNVLWLGLRQGLIVAGLGTAIGSGVAVATAGPLTPMLFNESPRDPLVYAAAVAVMLGVAGVASIIPARRAARVDPNVALRHE